MTYEATVEFKFDSTWEPTYGTSSWTDDTFLPEEHFVITAPAADLNAKQYFKLFEKFMLCVGMDPVSIRSGAMSLVFNDCVREEDQRKVCEEYELTMDEDLRSKFEDFKKLEEDWANLRKGPMGTVLEDDNPDWETRYHGLYRRFRRFASFTDDQLEELADHGEKTYYMGKD
jgi:hypothetical protein